MNLSKTQLANVSSIAGLIVLMANQFGWILEQNKVAFIMAGVWTLGWNAYNYYQRFKKGDLNLLGSRKN